MVSQEEKSQHIFFMVFIWASGWDSGRVRAYLFWAVSGSHRAGIEVLQPDDPTLPDLENKF